MIDPIGADAKLRAPFPRWPTWWSFRKHLVRLPQGFAFTEFITKPNPISSEKDGHWIRGRPERSRYYNHSTFADLVITGIAGLVPRDDHVLTVHPLLPPGTWDWFCLDGIPYRGRSLTILWDRTGTRSHRNPGLTVLIDGRAAAHGDDLGPLTARMP